MRVVKVTMFKRNEHGDTEWDQKTIVCTSGEFRKLRYMLAEFQDGQWLIEEVKVIDFTEAKEWIKNA